MLRQLCFCLCLYLAAAGVPKFTDCGVKSVGEVVKIDIDQCETGSASCVIHKGKDINLKVDFTPHVNSKKAEIQILAKIGELELEVPGVETDACAAGRMNPPCPLVKDTPTTYTYGVFIPKLVPDIEASLTAKLIGDNGTIACASLAGKVME